MEPDVGDGNNALAQDEEGEVFRADQRRLSSSNAEGGSLRRGLRIEDDQEQDQLRESQSLLSSEVRRIGSVQRQADQQTDRNTDLDSANSGTDNRLTQPTFRLNWTNDTNANESFGEQGLGTSQRRSEVSRSRLSQTDLDGGDTNAEEEQRSLAGNRKTSVSVVGAIPSSASASGEDERDLEEEKSYEKTDGTIKVTDKQSFTEWIVAQWRQDQHTGSLNGGAHELRTKVQQFTKSQLLAFSESELITEVSDQHFESEVMSLDLSVSELEIRQLTEGVRQRLQRAIEVYSSTGGDKMVKYVYCAAVARVWLQELQSIGEITRMFSNFGMGDKKHAPSSHTSSDKAMGGQGRSHGVQTVVQTNYPRPLMTLTQHERIEVVACLQSTTVHEYDHVERLLQYLVGGENHRDNVSCQQQLVSALDVLMLETMAVIRRCPSVEAVQQYLRASRLDEQTFYALRLDSGVFHQLQNCVLGLVMVITLIQASPHWDRSQSLRQRVGGSLSTGHVFFFSATVLPSSGGWWSELVAECRDACSPLAYEALREELADQLAKTDRVSSVSRQGRQISLFEVVGTPYSGGSESANCGVGWRTGHGVGHGRQENFSAHPREFDGLRGEGHRYTSSPSRQREQVCGQNRSERFSEHGQHHGWSSDDQFRRYDRYSTHRQRGNRSSGRQDDAQEQDRRPLDLETPSRDGSQEQPLIRPDVVDPTKASATLLTMDDLAEVRKCVHITPTSLKRKQKSVGDIVESEYLCRTLFKRSASELKVTSTVRDHLRLAVERALATKEGQPKGSSPAAKYKVPQLSDKQHIWNRFSLPKLMDMVGEDYLYMLLMTNEMVQDFVRMCRDIHRFREDGWEKAERFVKNYPELIQTVRNAWSPVVDVLVEDVAFQFDAQFWHVRHRSDAASHKLQIVIRAITAVNNRSDDNAREASKRHYSALRVGQILNGSAYSVATKWLRVIQVACLDGNTELDESTTSRRFAEEANRMLRPILITLKYQHHELHSSGNHGVSLRTVGEMKRAYGASVEYFEKLLEVFTVVLEKSSVLTLPVYSTSTGCSGGTVDVPVGPWVYMVGRLLEISKDRHQMDNLYLAQPAVQEAVSTWKKSKTRPTPQQAPTRQATSSQNAPAHTAVGRVNQTTCATDSELEPTDEEFFAVCQLRSEAPPALKCFKCGGSHKIVDCPRRNEETTEAGRAAQREWGQAKVQHRKTYLSDYAQARLQNKQARGRQSSKAHAKPKSSSKSKVDGGPAWWNSEQKSWSTTKPSKKGAPTPSTASCGGSAAVQQAVPVSEVEELYTPSTLAAAQRERDAFEEQLVAEAEGARSTLYQVQQYSDSGTVFQATCSANWDTPWDGGSCQLVDEIDIGGLIDVCQVAPNGIVPDVSGDYTALEGVRRWWDAPQPDIRVSALERFTHENARSRQADPVNSSHSAGDGPLTMTDQDLGVHFFHVSGLEPSMKLWYGNVSQLDVFDDGLPEDVSIVLLQKVSDATLQKLPQDQVLSAAWLSDTADDAATFSSSKGSTRWKEPRVLMKDVVNFCSDANRRYIFMCFHGESRSASVLHAVATQRLATTSKSEVTMSAAYDIVLDYCKDAQVKGVVREVAALDMQTSGPFWNRQGGQTNFSGVLRTNFLGISDDTHRRVRNRPDYYAPPTLPPLVTKRTRDPATGNKTPKRSRVPSRDIAAASPDACEVARATSTTGGTNGLCAIDDAVLLCDAGDGAPDNAVGALLAVGDPATAGDASGAIETQLATAGGAGSAAMAICDADSAGDFAPAVSTVGETGRAEIRKPADVTQPGCADERPGRAGERATPSMDVVVRSDVSAEGECPWLTQLKEAREFAKHPSEVQLSDIMDTLKANDMLHSYHVDLLATMVLIKHCPRPTPAVGRAVQLLEQQEKAGRMMTSGRDVVIFPQLAAHLFALIEQGIVDDELVPFVRSLIPQVTASGGKVVMITPVGNTLNHYMVLAVSRNDIEVWDSLQEVYGQDSMSKARTLREYAAPMVSVKLVACRQQQHQSNGCGLIAVQNMASILGSTVDVALECGLSEEEVEGWMQDEGVWYQREAPATLTGVENELARVFRLRGGTTRVVSMLKPQNILHNFPKASAAYNQRKAASCRECRMMTGEVRSKVDPFGEHGQCTAVACMMNLGGDDRVHKQKCLLVNLTSVKEEETVIEVNSLDDLRRELMRVGESHDRVGYAFQDLLYCMMRQQVCEEINMDVTRCYACSGRWRFLDGKHSHRKKKSALPAHVRWTKLQDLAKEERAQLSNTTEGEKIAVVLKLCFGAGILNMPVVDKPVEREYGICLPKVDGYCEESAIERFEQDTRLVVSADGNGMTSWKSIGQERKAQEGIVPISQGCGVCGVFSHSTTECRVYKTVQLVADIVETQIADTRNGAVAARGGAGRDSGVPGRQSYEDMIDQWAAGYDRGSWSIAQDSCGGDAYSEQSGGDTVSSEQGNRNQEDAEGVGEGVWSSSTSRIPEDVSQQADDDRRDVRCSEEREDGSSQHQAGGEMRQTEAEKQILQQVWDNRPDKLPNVFSLQNGLTHTFSEAREGWWFFPYSGCYINQPLGGGRRVWVNEPIRMNVLVSKLKQVSHTHELFGLVYFIPHLHSIDPRRLAPAYALDISGTVFYEALQSKLPTGGRGSNPVVSAGGFEMTDTEGKTDRGRSPVVEDQDGWADEMPYHINPVSTCMVKGPSMMSHTLLPNRKSVIEDFLVNAVVPENNHSLDPSVSRPPGTERGIPLPRMKPGSRTQCEDGSYVLVLDSGAEVSVFNTTHLLTKETSRKLRLNSFHGTTYECLSTGVNGGGVKNLEGQEVKCNLGYGGVASRHMVQDNLLSVPQLRKLGYQFWFGQFPYAVTPQGDRLPLYVKENGYLCLRVHASRAHGSDDQEAAVGQIRTDEATVQYLERDILLWHRRFAHVDAKTLRYMKNKELVHGLPKELQLIPGSHSDCLSCGMGKSCEVHVGPINHTNVKLNSKVSEDVGETRQTEFYPLEQIHMDCCEMDAPDLFGNRHFLVIVDRATSYMWNIPLKDKKDLSKIIEKFLRKVVEPYHQAKNRLHLEKQQGEPGEVQNILPGLRRVRCDCGTEFLNQEMEKLGNKFGFVMDPVAPYVNDGRAEAAVKKLTVLTRTNLIDANLRKPFWGPIMDMVCHVLNRTYTRSVDGVPFTALTGLKPDVSYFRQPGCHALCHIPDGARKSDKKAFIGILINYDTAKNTYIFLEPNTGRLVRTAHATFYERGRRHEEHIDMGSMMLHPPSRERDMLVESWRCQLWPKVLYPGMDVDRANPKKPPVPRETESSARLDSNIIFNRDVVKGAEETTASFANIGNPDSMEESASTGLEAQCTPVLSSHNTLKATSVSPSTDNEATLVTALTGLTIGDALKTKVTSPTGGHTSCSLSLLRALLAKNLLQSVSPSSSTAPSTDEHSARPVGTTGADEDLGVEEAIREMTSGRRLPRTRRERTLAAQTGKVLQTIVAVTFDEYFRPADQLEAVVTHLKPLQKVPEMVVGAVTAQHTDCQEMCASTKCPLNLSSVEVCKLPVAERACREELEAMQPGTYVDQDGGVHLNYNVRRALSHYTRDVQAVVQEAVDFVWDVPPVDGVMQVQQVSEETVEVKAPTGSRRAMSLDTHLMWRQCTIEEINGLYKMGCVEYVKLDDPRLVGATVLPSHVVYVAKYTSDVPAKFIKAKARLVADGNFEPSPETPFANFSPTAGPCLNRLCDAYALKHGYLIWTTDCTQAFLNSPTTTDIFIRPPPGCGVPGYVWRLKKYLYGLCAAPAAWMKTLSEELVRHGFKAFDDDPCLLRLKKASGTEIVVCVFVDDLKWATNDPEALKDVIAKIGDKFKITVGKTPVTTSNRDQVDWNEAVISTYLGMRYTHNTSQAGKHTLVVDQTAYIDKLTERFELEDALDAHTPLPALSTPSQLRDRMGVVDNDELKQWATTFSFPVIVGSLIHAMVHTRPDIAYAVSILSRSMADPEPFHYKAARQVLRYLKTTRTLGVCYRQESMNADKTVTAAVEESSSAHHFPVHDDVLEAAADASFGDDPETYRSTGGFVVWFGGSPVDFECKRQPLVTMSTLESEYVCASRCVLSIRFLHKFLRFMELTRSGPTMLHEDNSACIAISNKPVHRMRSKHIGIKYHNVREAVQNNEVELVPIWTEHNVSDIFTKSQSRAMFERCREVLLGYKSLQQMMTDYPKPHVVNACELGDADTLCSDVQSHVDEIMGFGTVHIPGYGAQLCSGHGCEG